MSDSVRLSGVLVFTNLAASTPRNESSIDCRIDVAQGLVSTCTEPEFLCGTQRQDILPSEAKHHPVEILDVHLTIISQIAPLGAV